MDIVNIVSSLGFPIVIALILLVQVNRVIESNTQAINYLAGIICRHYNVDGHHILNIYERENLNDKQ